MVQKEFSSYGKFFSLIRIFPDVNEFLNSYRMVRFIPEMTIPTGFHKTVIIVTHAVVGWAYCGALIGVGHQLLPLHKALILHAIGAPIGFAFISRFYYRQFAYTGPGQTAAAFVGVVVFLDVFLVAPVFEKNFAMFSSILGTWVPFTLIFAATYLTGRFGSTAARSSGRG
jgi:hypothetical protein